MSYQTNPNTPDIIHIDADDLAEMQETSDNNGAGHQLDADMQARPNDYTYVDADLLRKIDQIARQGENGSAHDGVTTCTHIRDFVNDILAQE